MWLWTRRRSRILTAAKFGRSSVTFGRMLAKYGAFWLNAIEKIVLPITGIRVVVAQRDASWLMALILPIGNLVHHLDPVAERIPGVEPLEPTRVVALRPVDVEPDRLQPLSQRLQFDRAVDGERGMGALGGTHLDLDAEMDLRTTLAAQPRAAALRELGRLVDLGHAEAVAVEAAPGLLAARRDGDLDVVEPHARTAFRVPTTKIRRNGSTTWPSR